MLICIDFDKTVVEDQPRDFGRQPTPRGGSWSTENFVFRAGAKEALLSLKAAGHILLLVSVRSNRAKRFDQMLDPLIKAGVIPALTPEQEAEEQRIHHILYEHMISFVNAELPGIFDAIDDGQQGKPWADIYIDDKAIRHGDFGEMGSFTWAEIDELYGEKP